MSTKLASVHLAVIGFIASEGLEKVIFSVFSHQGRAIHLDPIILELVR